MNKIRITVVNKGLKSNHLHKVITFKAINGEKTYSLLKDSYPVQSVNRTKNGYYVFLNKKTIRLRVYVNTLMFLIKNR